jgi:methionine synthase II (cobalamin-independent)
MITKDIYIEDLINLLPEAVGYLMDNGIKCIACGEPIWGTLEQAAREKGKTNAEIETYVRELNEMLSSKTTNIGIVKN